MHKQLNNQRIAQPMERAKGETWKVDGGSEMQRVHYGTC